MAALARPFLTFLFMRHVHAASPLAMASDDATAPTTDRDRRVQGERGNQGLHGRMSRASSRIYSGGYFTASISNGPSDTRDRIHHLPLLYGTDPFRQPPLASGVPACPRSRNKCPNTFAAVPPAFFLQQEVHRGHRHRHAADELPPPLGWLRPTSWAYKDIRGQ